MKKCFLLFLIIIAHFAITNAANKDSANQNSKISVKKDTVFIIQQSSNDNIAKNYQQILEKTNNQLSLWFNPYGLFVTMLGVLFAILAIVAAFVIYRQSKEYKGLIQKSLTDHKTALDKLIIEKSEQLKNYEVNLDKSIKEYKEQLTNVDGEHQVQIQQFISKLEEQKSFIETQFNIHKHAGWAPKDIPVNIPINNYSDFNAKIILPTISQHFVIYMRVRTNDNKHLWLGFAGSDVNAPYFDREEYTHNRVYNSLEVIISENIYSYFKFGFPNYTSKPVLVDCIRLRGSTMDDNEIIYQFKIS